MSPLLAAMMQAMQAQQPKNSRTQNATSRAAIARAMLGRKGAEGQKNLSLPALKPYGESDFADRYGGGPNPQQGAFQTDAYQNDAFQVDGVI